MFYILVRRARLLSGLRAHVKQSILRMQCNEIRLLEL